MNRTRGVLALALMMALSVPAWGSKLSTQRVNSYKCYGAAGNIRVPYMTTGNSVFMRNGYTSPLIYRAPGVDNPYNPGARPGYNLPFYGARMGFTDNFNGYIPKPMLLPSNAK
jgi:hypothetical protein